MIIDGKELARKTREKLKIECDNLKKEGILSKLAVIMVGDDKASQIYVKNKSKACQEIGIKFEEYFLGNDIKQEELIELIQKLNLDKSINGILLQSPIPKSLDINEAFRIILPEKDVDGFNPINVGKLCLNQETFVSCTPYGIMKMFEEYDIDLTGKNVTILGRSNIVGKPLIQCCLNKNATVTVCHSKTKDLKEMPYVRVLAFNDKGCEILKEIKKNSEIEVITKFSKIKHIDSDIFNTLINYDIKATNMYSLIYNKSLLKGPMDYITSPKYIK